MDLRSYRPEAAEFIGTFLLVAVGAGAATLGPPWVFLVPGLVVGGCVYAFGRVSGAHFNPAVTLGFVLAGEFPPRRAISFLAVQFGGALTGALVLAAALGAGMAPAVTHVQAALSIALLSEFAATSLLMFVIMAAATDSRLPRWASGAAIGGAVVIGVAFAGPLTGGSMNPARTLGPAFATATFADLWLYLLAPMAGAASAALAYRWFRGPSHHRPGARGEVPRDVAGP